MAVEPVINSKMSDKRDSDVVNFDSAESLGLNELKEIENRSYRIIKQLEKVAFAPDRVKRLELRFKLSEAADMAGITPQSIRNAEKDGRIPPAELDDKGKRTYTLEAINRIRKEFSTLPWRDPQEEPIIVPVQNFKGGVGKSTCACNLAQYLALKGYRVCLIDCDPQGSSTMLFGFNPDFNVSSSETLIPYLEHGGEQDLNYALKDTHWPGIKLIPANMDLGNAEYLLAAKVHGNPEMLNKLRRGIDTIKDQFDVIIIDPPPALGFISLSVIRAANALLIPVPPATIDFTSSAHFFSMLRENLEVLESRGLKARFKFLKVLVSKLQENKLVQKEIVDAMKDNYGHRMISTFIKDSVAIDNATGALKTVYEITHDDLKRTEDENGEVNPPLVSRDAYLRCRAYLDGAHKEIEILMRQTWPSHLKTLRREGLI